MIAENEGKDYTAKQLWELAGKAETVLYEEMINHVWPELMGRMKRDAADGAYELKFGLIDLCSPEVWEDWKNKDTDMVIRELRKRLRVLGFTTKSEGYGVLRVVWSKPKD